MSHEADGLRPDGASAYGATRAQSLSHARLSGLRASTTSDRNPEVAIRPFKKAIGFVDWHTAVIASGAAIRSGRQETIAERTLRHVERIVSDYLNASAGGSKFEVRLRLYAGWHSGKTRTPYFHGITKVMKTYARKARSYHAGRVAFRGGDQTVFDWATGWRAFQGGWRVNKTFIFSTR